MLDVKKIKLRREKDEYDRMTYILDAGTKHLPAGTEFRKHYSYNAYCPKGYMLTGRYEHLGTLKAVKEWIANYDDIRDAEIAAEKAEREAEEAKRLARLAAEKAATEDFLAPVDNAPVINENDRVNVRECKLSKPSFIGEVINELNPDVVEAEIVKVINVSNEEFDAACRDLYNNFPKEWLKLEGEAEHEFGGGYIGGYESNDPRLEGMDYDEVFTNPVNTAIFRETSFMKAHVMVAPNRKPLFVNTEGYGYPRYVAFAA